MGKHVGEILTPMGKRNVSLLRIDERIHFIMPNAPQQRPRATGVRCKQSGIAGSAGCGGWAHTLLYKGRRNAVNRMVAHVLDRLRKTLSSGKQQSITAAS